MRISLLGATATLSFALLALTWPSVTFAATCLSKQVSSAESTTGEIRILAPDSEADAYEKLGYSAEKCSAGVEQSQRFVDFICSVRQRAPAQYRDALQQTYGVPLERICASARNGLAEMTTTNQ